MLLLVLFFSFDRSSEKDQLRTLNLEQRLSLGSDDEIDLVQELQSMCSSKSEPDISKVNMRFYSNLHHYHMQLFAMCLKQIFNLQAQLELKKIIK